MAQLMAFAFNDTTKIILWVVLAATALGLITLMVHTAFIAHRRKKNNGKAQTEENSETPAGTEEEYSAQANADEIVLSRNVIYSAGADGQIKAGKYALQSADGSTYKFNVRFNGLVKEYRNGDTVTITDGDTISSVSGSVVLNRVD